MKNIWFTCEASGCWGTWTKEEDAKAHQIGHPEHLVIKHEVDWEGIDSVDDVE